MRSQFAKSTQSPAFGGGYGQKQLIDELILHLFRSGLIGVD